MTASAAVSEYSPLASIIEVVDAKGIEVLDDAANARMAKANTRVEIRIGAIVVIE
jgi:hypothetical protein